MAKAGPPNEIHREIQKKKHVDASVLQKATKPPRNYASKALVHLQKCSVYGHEKVKYLLLRTPQCFQSSGAEMRRIQVGRGVA
jgi:hypothetical protein